MWSILTPSSRVSSMPITFGQPCRVNVVQFGMALVRLWEFLAGGFQAYSFRVVG